MKKTYLFMSVILTMLLAFAQVKADVVDVSNIIINNDFTGDAAAWTVAQANYSGFVQDNGVREAYAADNGNKWFSCYQDVVVPAGIYRLSAGAFHRGYLNDNTNIILYATTSSKEYSVDVKSLKSEAVAYGSTPSSRVTAKTAFDNNYWINTVNEIVVPDAGEGTGTLRIGIRNIAQAVRATGATAGDIWTVWSNFKLYRLTGADLDSKRDQVVTQANVLLAEVTAYDDNGSLLAAISTLSGITDADLTVEAINTLEAAMTTYRNNRISSGSSAKPVDVSHLINNPSFDNGQTSLVGTANGHYNQPIGWTLNYGTPTDLNNNITIISNKVVPAGVAAGFTINPTNGNRSFVARYRWTTGQTMSITQTVSGLTAGKYRISADLGKLSANGNSTLSVTIGGANVMTQAAALTAGPSFAPVTATFDALQGENMVITATMTQVGQVEATIILDNIKLEYLGVEPFISANQSTLAFSPSVNQKVINIKAGNLTNDITLTPSASFELSTYSISAATAMTTSGVDVTVTCNGTSEIADGTLTLTSGTVSSVVNLMLTETPITVSNSGFFFDQSLTPNATFTVTGDLLNDIHLSAPTGISLSQETVTKAEALAGKAITLTWDLSTRVLDQNITLTSGAKSSSVLVFAVNDNKISTWDGDAAEGDGSKLTDFGWSQTLADGVTAGPASFQNYAVGGVRYVAASSAAHIYRGTPWAGYRVAYLRTWGNPATNAFNLQVNLDADKTYVFRGVSAWHNNENNPTFTYSVNTQKANTGTSLGSQSVLCTVRQRGEDYGFEFTPTTTGIHYLVVTSDAKDDAMLAPDYLAIYPKVQTATGTSDNQKSKFSVYPTISNGNVTVDLNSQTGTIRVFDMTGKMIHSRKAIGSVENFELSGNGMFMFEIRTEKYTEIVKVVNMK